ncbi:MAG: hypothetical protein AAF153_01740, partial [Pseudomonadota bacterium]
QKALNSIDFLITYYPQMLDTDSLDELLTTFKNVFEEELTDHTVNTFSKRIVDVYYEHLQTNQLLKSSSTLLQIADKLAMTNTCSYICLKHLSCQSFCLDLQAISSAMAYELEKEEHSLDTDSDDGLGHDLENSDCENWFNAATRSQLPTSGIGGL